MCHNRLLAGQNTVNEMYICDGSVRRKTQHNYHENPRHKLEKTRTVEYFYCQVATFLIG